MRALFCLLALLPVLAEARPPAGQALGATLVDSGSAHYRFEHFELALPDASRQYRVRLGIPRSPAPAAGYPVIYLLDGNAALMALREEWLAELPAETAPVLVLVGPVSDLRVDLPGRVFDYTPASPAGMGAPDSELAGLPSGGAQPFRDFLRLQVRPQVAERVAIDNSRQTLWGHSLGGLFVFDSLRCCAADYRHYVAASPSLWWQSGLLLQRFEGFAGAEGASLLVLQGSAERNAEHQRGSPRARSMAAVPASATRGLSERLDALPGLQSRYHELAGLDHGQMLAASLRIALRVAAGLPPVTDEGQP